MGNFFTATLIAFTGLVIVGCSSLGLTSNEDSLFRNKALDYTRSQSVQRLQVPAHLENQRLQNDLLIVPKDVVTQGVAGIEEAPRPSFTFAELGSANVQMRGTSIDKYLLVNASYSQVVEKLKAYLKSHNQLIDTEDDKTEVIETQWTPLPSVNVKPSVVSDFLRGITGGDKKLAYSKTRIKTLETISLEDKPLIKVNVDYVQASYAQVANKEQANWQVQDQFIEEKRAVLFDLMRFLKQTFVAASLNDSTVKPKILYGQTHGGEPILRVETSQQEAMNVLLKAMTNMDVGSFYKETGRIYFTHTSTQRAAASKAESTGFWAWFKDLHSGNDEQESIVLSKSDDEKSQAKPIIYSKNGVLPSVTDDLADKKGHKVWIGGKVIFVFEDEDQGDIDSEGNYIFTDNYQLHLTRSLNGVYVRVYNARGKQPATVYTEEILAQIIDGLSL